MITIVSECDSICQANGVGFAFFAMPYSHQYTLKSDRFAVQEKIEASLSAEGIKVIPHPGETLLETYSNHPEKAYLFGDGIHFSIGGHIKIAEHLERELAIQPQVLEPTVP
jgi:lysophospholipase L1-like esterase